MEKNGRIIRFCALLIAAVFLTSGLVLLPVVGEIGSAFFGSNRGSPTETENPLTVLVEGLGEFDDDGFGWNISSAGDVNDDGYDDIIVGAPFYDDAGDNDAGCAYIFFGKADWTGENLTANHSDVQILGLDPGDHMGWDVDCAGDVNFDGVDDIIIGAPNEGWGGGVVNGGRAHIYYGGAYLDTTPVLTWNDHNEYMQGSGSNQLLGFSVSGAGDLNDDGIDDVAIGAPGGSYTRIRFGFDSITRYYITADSSNPLWDDTTATTNYVDFNSLLNNSNTFAPATNPSNFDHTTNDGWDWSYDWEFERWGAIGLDNSSHLYGPQNDTGEGLPLDGSKRIQAQVGPSNDGNDGWNMSSDHEDMCAWGVQINITQNIWSQIQGEMMYVEFDWEAFDTGQAMYDAGKITWVEPSLHEYWVKAQFFRNGTDPENNYLGTNQDGWGNVEVHYVDGAAESAANDDWGWTNSSSVTNSGTFSDEVTGEINGPNMYYLTLGVKQMGFEWGGATATYTDNQGIGCYFDNVTMYTLKQRPADIYINGINDFGWDVAGGGDINNDGIDDVIISNPMTGIVDAKGEVSLFCGFTGLTDTGSGSANSTIMGLTNNSLFGYSIDIAGDINNDNYDDMIIGAPGEDKVYIYNGETEPPKTATYINVLWDDNTATSSIVDFDTEYNNTDADINTWGIYAPPGTSWDGWDWAQDEYGQQNDGGFGFTWWSPNEALGGPDMGIAIPGGVGVGGEIDFNGGENAIASAAFGVQFNISAANWTTISTQIAGGATLLAEFDWEVEDRDATEEPVWVKARIGTSNATMWYLGENLDGGSFTISGDTFNDPMPEVHIEKRDAGLGGGGWFGEIQRRASLDVTSNITSAGTYYLDFGVKTQTGVSGMTGGQEGFTFQFDDVALVLKPVWVLPATNVIVGGGVNESFGHSVHGIANFDQDQYADIIIGAPYADNTNGVNSGATYIFTGSGSLAASINAETAAYINYGNNSGMCYGFAVGNCGQQTGTMDNPGVGNPRWWNATFIQLGQAQVLGIPTVPSIAVTAPNGGETVSGMVQINATATDPQANLNLVVGVKFAIRPDGDPNWVALGADTAPIGDLFDLTFDSTMYPDGDYWVKANVTDLTANFREDVCDGFFTIDNLFAPSVNFTMPLPADKLNYTLDISADAYDSPMDLVLGLDYTTGMTFYYSRDNTTWTLIGTDNTTASGNTWGLTAWNITGFADGICYLNASVLDIDGVEGMGYTNFMIVNPKLAPNVVITHPWNTSAELQGNVIINATVFDANEDIPAGNVTFFYSKDGGTWTTIGTGLSGRGSVDYYQNFDSSAVADGLYSFKVEVIDDSGLTDEDITPQFLVHNDLNNPPIVNVVYPNGGETFSQSGTITIKAFVFDLEDNINPMGAVFSYSTDKENWTVIGSDPTGVDNIYEMPWDTNALPDEFYYIQVNATDTDGNLGSDTSNATFTIHNKMDNPPKVLVKYPDGGEVLKGTVTVQVWAFDFEQNIRGEGVILYYSNDAGLTWEVLGSIPTHTNNYYNISWDTTTVPDGDQYLINATATDITSRMGYDTSNATFTIMNLDAHPPVVSITEPLAGATVEGEINVSAIATDMDNDIDGGVTFSVKLMGETDWTEIGKAAIPVSGNTYTIQWDTNTTEFPNGDYIIKADVIDLAKLNATDIIAAAITINNPDGGGGGDDNHDPDVDITNPKEGDELDDTVTITVDVTDEDGDLDSIEFFIDSGAGRISIHKIDDPSGTTFTYSWDTTGVANGTYKIILVATDANGNTVEQEIEITVVNESTGPIIDDDDDDDEKGFLATWWWLLLLLVLLLVIVLIVIIFLVMRKKNVEVQIGPFELFGKTADGRVLVICEDKEYSGGTDKDGIGHVTNVDKDLMGKDGTIRCEFGEKTYEFIVMLEPDKVIPPPTGWMTKLVKPDKDGEEEEKKDLKAEGDLPPKAEHVDDEDTDGDVPKVAHPEDDLEGIGLPPEDEAEGLPEGPSMKALPPGAEDDDTPGEYNEEKVDLDADAPADAIDHPEDEGLPEMDEAGVDVGDKPAELDEDDIDLDSDLDLDDLDLD